MAIGNLYSAQIGFSGGNNFSASGDHYEAIVTDTFVSACAIARTLCKHGEIVKGVTLSSEGVIVDTQALDSGD